MRHFLRHTLFSRTLTLLLTGLLLASQAMAQAQTKALLWEIKSGKQSGFILGSIHVAKPEFYPLPQQVEKAYKQAGHLAVEADASNEAAIAKIRPLMLYGDGDKLENHLKPATWEKFKSLAGEAGASQFQTLKPMTAATVISIAALREFGYSSEQGIDLHFIARAKKDHKPMSELESIEFQGNLLSKMSDEDGDAMLLQTLDNIGNGEAVRQINAMVAAWKGGDAPALTKLLEEMGNQDSGSQKLMKLLFDDRNDGMAQKIATLVKSGKRPFVVIGAGHMTSGNNILTILEKQGFTVRQVR